MKLFLSIVLSLSASMASQAQKFAVSTNLVEWANFLTLNLSTSVSISRHTSLSAGVRYNPWTFHSTYEMPICANQKTANFGVRYWPWYVYSGWWFGTKVQYMDFTETGVLRPKVFQGKSIGLGLSFGYSWMLHEHLNIEAGCGLWGGRHFQYSVYRTAASMDLLRSGPKNFIFIDDLTLSIVYVF